MDTPFDLRFCGGVRGREVRIPTVAETHFLAPPLTCGDAMARTHLRVHKFENHD